MNAVVIGGSGATGKELVKQLVNTDWITNVIVLLRRKTFIEYDKLKEIIVDFDRLDDFAEYIQGDISFSCLGTTLKAAGSKTKQWKVDYDYQLKFAEIAKKNNIPLFILVSSQNANKKSIFFYSKMKGKLEKSIINLDFERLIIFRPGILIRPNSDRTIENIAVSFMKGLNKAGILNKRNAPLPVSYLAKAMINSVNYYNSNFQIISASQIIKLID